MGDWHLSKHTQIQRKSTFMKLFLNRSKFLDTTLLTDWWMRHWFSCWLKRHYISHTGILYLLLQYENWFTLGHNSNLLMSLIVYGHIATAAVVVCVWVQHTQNVLSFTVFWQALKTISVQSVNKTCQLKYELKLVRKLLFLLLYLISSLHVMSHYFLCRNGQWNGQGRRKNVQNALWLKHSRNCSSLWGTHLSSVMEYKAHIQVQ